MSKLVIFDFDDTLVKTGSKIKITRSNGKTSLLTPAQYATHTKEPNSKYDFNDFDQLIEPASIIKYAKLLKAYKSSCSDCEIVILTARTHTKPVAKYLSSIGLSSGIVIAAVDGSDPTLKANYIRRKAERTKYSDIIVYDDSYKNIRAIEQLGSILSPTRIHTHLVN